MLDLLITCGVFAAGYYTGTGKLQKFWKGVKK